MMTEIDRIKAESVEYWEGTCRRASRYSKIGRRKPNRFDSFAVDSFVMRGDGYWKGYLDMMCYWNRHVDSDICDCTAIAATVDALIRTEAGIRRRRSVREEDLPRSRFDFERFLNAQRLAHRDAAEELRHERKEGHWMWFEFPQMRGLGVSAVSMMFGITGRDEAEAYLRHPVLASRLYELCTILLNRQGESVRAVFGCPDDLKLRSSMTLFDAVEPDGIFADVLEAFCSGSRCERTLTMLKESKKERKVR